MVVGVLVAAACVAIATLAVRYNRKAQGTTRPNVVLITFCTMRADRIGCYGYLPADTPNFDALAAQGVVFDSHYTQASFSGGAFASIHTGRYCFNHGVFDHPAPLADRNTTMAEILAQAGYRTAAFVTHRFVAPGLDFDQGFEVYSHNKRPKRQAKDAAAWIAKHAGEPFFLWYQAQPAHFPYRVPRKLLRPEASPPDLTINRHTKTHGRSPRAIGRLMFEFESFGYTPEQFASTMALYDATVSFCDQLAGLIVDQLAESGLLDNTVIIVTSDHGDTHGEHGLYFNHAANLYESTVRVPLMVRLPDGERAGERVAAVTRHIDLLASVAELAGVTPPEESDGASFWPVLAGAAEPRDAFAESGVFRKSRLGMANYRQYTPGPAGKWRTIRRGNHKLIHIPGDGGRADVYELYDLAADPAEANNLSALLPDQRQTLARDLDAWFASYSGAQITPPRHDEQDLETLRSLGYID